MKAIRITTYALFLCLGLLQVNCSKSDKSGDPDPDPDKYTPEYVTATVTGRVVDDNSKPVSAAVIKAGAASTTTDANGNFTLSNVSLDKNAGHVKVEKDGFFAGNRTFTVNAASTNNVTIQLIKKTVAGTINSATGGNVTVPSGGSISFTDNSIVNNATNASYSGTVSVNAFFINPAASNFRDIMPGSLTGINSNTQLVGLKSFGMMAVELTGAAGEKLQLAAGKSATITFPIPTALQASAPATIALWSFNDTTGLWKQEGTATKEGNNYVAKVGHFSFWNCDDPFPVVNFTVVLKDKGNNPIRNVEVVLQITGDTLNPAGYGYTDNSGKVSGAIPVNKSLKMIVYSTCGTVIHTQDIGPFSANTDLGVLSINYAGPLSVTITGTVVNCTGNPVTNGQVIISLYNKSYGALVKNGSFSISLDRCDNATVTAKLKAMDLDGVQEGTETSLSVGTGTVNAGTLSACGNALSEFINFTYNGTQILLTPPEELIAERINTTTEISGIRNNQNNLIVFSFQGDAQAGTVVVDTLNFIAESSTWRNSSAINATITEYGQVGGYIAGNFSGSARRTSNTNPTPVPVSCTFRIKRRQ